MASTFSTDLALELVATGEKAGLWGTITNTNLQILQQSTSGVIDVAMTASSDKTLLFSDGATSDGKNIYLKLTGTMTANVTASGNNLIIRSGSVTIVGTASIEAPATPLTLRTGEVGVITWNEIIPGATMVWTPIKPYG